MNALYEAIKNATYSEEWAGSAENLARATMYATIAIAQSLAAIAESLAESNARAEAEDERAETRRIYS